MSNSVTFRKITEDEFNSWRDWSIKDYAGDLFNAGQSSLENSIEKATAEFNMILAEGLATPNNYIYIVENIDKETVGIVWYETNSSGRAFIADLIVVPNQRGKGHGKSILKELESVVKEQNITDIVLHVFEKNAIARELYKKAGYVKADAKNADEGSIYMKKQLI